MEKNNKSALDNLFNVREFNHHHHYPDKWARTTTTNGDIVSSLVYDIWTILFGLLNLYTIENLKHVCKRIREHVNTAYPITPSFRYGLFSYFKKNAGRSPLIRFKDNLHRSDPDEIIPHILRKYDGIMLGEYVLHALDTPIHIKGNEIIIYMRYRRCKRVKKISNYISDQFLRSKEKIYKNHTIERKCLKDAITRPDILSALKIKLNPKFDNETLIKILFYDPIYGSHDAFLNLYDFSNYQKCTYDGRRLDIHDYEELLRGRVRVSDRIARQIEYSRTLSERMRYYYERECPIRSMLGILVKEGKSFVWKNR